MRAMKDSRIVRLGDIPTTWSMSRIKYVYSVIGSGTTPTSGTEIYYNNGDYYWIQSGDLYKTKYITDTEKKLTKEAITTFSSLTEYKANFFVIAMYGASIGNVSISKIDARTNQACCAIKPKNTIDFTYLYYMLLVDKDIMLDMSIGGTQPNISQAKILEIPIVLPTLSEQVTISAYLDEKCTEIDSLISDIQKQIETLEQYKRSVITEAVTKGLNPDAKMKDSEIEWISQIPESWTTNKIKYLFTNYKGLSITKENLIERGLPVISYGQIHSKNNSGTNISESLLRYVDYQYQTLSPQCEVFQYDFVFADTSEDYEGCGNCVYKRDSSLLFGGYHTIILHSKFKVDNRYFAYLFQTDCWRKQIREVASGVKLFSITQKALMNSSLIIPQKDEQQKIADYLDGKCTEIDNLITEKKQQIETIEEYKKSLIFEYVTGKKEVVISKQAVLIDPVVLAAMAIDVLDKDLIGKVKLQKAILLCEMLFKLPMNIQYYRYQQGPYDLKLNTYLESINKKKWFDINIKSSPMQFSRGQNYSDYLTENSEIISEYIPKFKRIFDFLRPMREKQAGRVATLFAVWNDMIIDGVTEITDEKIIYAARNNWTKNKKNPKISTWQHTLNKMKANNIVPTGFGLHTLPKNDSDKIGGKNE